MHIRLSKERERDLIELVKRLYLEEFEEELSEFRGRRILRFFVRRLGPAVYNQAIQDARGYLAERLEDLDVEFYEPDPSSGGSDKGLGANRDTPG